MFNSIMKLYASTVVAVAILAGGALGYAQNFTPSQPINNYMTQDDIISGSWIGADFQLNVADDVRPHFAAGENGDCLSGWINNQSSGTLIFSYSADGGTSWTPSSFSSLSGNIVDFNIAYAGNNTWAAIYSTSRAVTEVYASRSTDNGQTWSAPVRLDVSTPNPLDFQLHRLAHIAADKQGHLITLWNEREDTTSKLKVSRSADFGQTWSAADTLVTQSRIPGEYPYYDFDQCALATNDAGRWTILYSSYASDVTTGGLVYYHTATSLDNGLNWTFSPSLFTSSPAGGMDSVEPLQPVVCAYNDTIVIANWAYVLSGSSLNVELQARTSTDGGSTYDAPLIVDSSPSWFYSFPRIPISMAADSTGNLFLISESTSLPASEFSAPDGINIWKSDDPGTTWSLSSSIPASGQNFTNTAVEATTASRFLMAFDAYVPDAYITNRDFDIHTIQTADAGDNWTTATYLNDYATTDVAGVNDFGSTIDSNGDTMIAAWLSKVAENVLPNLMISISSDKGQTWAQAQQLLTNVDWDGTRIIYAGNDKWIIAVSKASDASAASLSSLDNGLSWNPPALGPVPFVSQLVSDRANRLVMLNKTPAYSDDAGITWTNATVGGIVTSQNIAHMAHSGGSNWFGIRTESYLSVISSTDNGVTWTNAGAPPGLDQFFKIQQLATNHNGQLLIIGQTYSPPAESLKTVYTMGSVSNDNGLTWSTPEIIKTDIEWVPTPPSAWIKSIDATSSALWVQGSYWQLFNHIQLRYNFSILGPAYAYSVQSTDGIVWSPPNTVIMDELDATGARGVTTFAVSGNSIVNLLEPARFASSPDLKNDADIGYRTMQSAPITAAKDWSLFE